MKIWVLLQWFTCPFWGVISVFWGVVSNFWGVISGFLGRGFRFLARLIHWGFADAVSELTARGIARSL